MAMIGPSMAAGIIKNEKECDLTCFHSFTLVGSKAHKDVYVELKVHNIIKTGFDSIIFLLEVAVVLVSMIKYQGPG